MCGYATFLVYCITLILFITFIFGVVHFIIYILEPALLDLLF